MSLNLIFFTIVVFLCGIIIGIIITYFYITSTSNVKTKGRRGIWKSKQYQETDYDSY